MYQHADIVREVRDDWSDSGVSRRGLSSSVSVEFSLKALKLKARTIAINDARSLDEPTLRRVSARKASARSSSMSAE